MSSDTSAPTRPHPSAEQQPCRPAFSHQALLYADAEGFLATAARFVREGLALGEPVMVAVTAARRHELEGELGPAAEQVQFLDMEAVGRNPARIIPVWRRFVEEHVSPAQPARGIGEPVWPGRERDELAECERHEALLNLAFADSPGWQLLCPYDVGRLDDATLARVAHTHPQLTGSEGLRPSEDYLSPYHAPDPLAGGLPEPPEEVEEIEYDVDRLKAVRELVACRAAAAGLDRMRASELVLAVDELASNSIRHADGAGRLRIWREDGRLVCETRDRGRIRDPLAGRHEPGPRQACGRGLWIANQVCDLVQLRSGERTVVRAHVRLAA